ncbi:MBL fold metallo-hydrolase [Parasphingorhabdus sp.]|uniref:MBL fold metallo-hydrolase n=1 Tax=Parasphingorhabdus sp. TaxID=2709688 RepID=UPI003BAFC6A6
MLKLTLLLASTLAAVSVPAQAQQHGGAAADQTVQLEMGSWVTLGTRGGPVTSPTRSQPANLLTFGGKHYLVDVGDGTAGQSGKVGVQTDEIDGIFISHLHFDHTAGLLGILGLRFQTRADEPLTIYGPPGTQELVDGLLAGMLPGATANYGVAGAPIRDHTAGIEVVELRDRDSVEVDGMTVTVRSNTHYSFVPGSDLAARFQALSLRFDLPGRSIVYTGDTGPSTAVEELAQGADLLVAEMMDVPLIVSNVRKANPNMPEPALNNMATHLRDHHLLPKDVGEMAKRAGVRAVVVTHFAGAERDSPKFFEYLKTIAEHYDGPVVVANDMDSC